MRSEEGRNEEGKEVAPEEESLADKALEAIIRSQQLRERSRRLRDEAPDCGPKEDGQS
jgi:hypothetical protein